MALSALAVIGGFVLLLFSADRFVLAASAIAKAFGVSPLLIGVTVVGFGTSAPEIFIALMASLDGSASLAVGNALGSNTANILLILGATAVLAPIAIAREDVREEILLLGLATALCVGLLADGALRTVDGIALMAGFAGFVGWAIHSARRQSSLAEEVPDDLPPVGRAWVELFVAMIVLVLSSRLLVWGATEIAAAMGISELVIGLTIVAIGSSLPELAASLASARRGQGEMALGNVLGSNLFNTLAVLAVPALIAAPAVDPAVNRRDLPVMLFATVLLFYFVFRRKTLLSRGEGVMLLCGFSAYMLWLGVERAA